MTRGLVSLADAITELGERFEAGRLAQYLAERERAETLYACAGCGHDSRTHQPHNVPPYACGVGGCQCSRTPDALIVEPPDADETEPVAPERKAS